MIDQTRSETTLISRVPPKNILLVEDAPDVAEVLRSFLLRLGHEPVMAENGRQALALYNPGKFDLVVTDYSMPRMNGVELAEIIKRREPQQLILMMTAYAFTLAAYDGRPLPVDRVLRKPFHPRELNQTLGELFPGSTGLAQSAQVAV